MIYTDSCCITMMTEIKEKLNLEVLLRMNTDEWTLYDSMRIITDPELKLAVINTIDDISIMEIAMLNFLCKPIIVTTNAINEYNALIKTVTFIDINCNITNSKNNFISWYITYFLEKYQ